MRKKPLIVISICAVVLLLVSSLSNVVGCQSVRSSRPSNLPPWPSEGIVGENYTFCIQIPEDPDQEQFWVFWDWGDGTTSSWLGPFNSGEITCASHAWVMSGQYLIRLKLKDSEGNQTEWITWMIHIYGITTCEIRAASVYFGKLWFDIKNTGEDDAVRLNWSIEIEVIISPPSMPWVWNGTLQQLGISQSERISTNRFLISFGFRRITITITAFNIEIVTRITRGLFLGPIIILIHPLTTTNQT
ncbi:MAG: hypothetical protein WC525_03875 [Candidatus Thermoplasmatota archaeon]